MEKITGNLKDLSVLTLNDIKFAANLVWTPAYPASEAAAAKAELSVQLDSQLSCCYKTGDKLIQYGIGDAGTEHQHNLPVLAACIRHPLEESFCGAWLIDDQRWLILAVDSERTIHVDKIVATEGEARADILEALNQGEWQHSYTPDQSWIAHSGEAYLPLTELLVNKPKCQLKDSKTVRKLNLLKLLAGVALAATFYTGYSWWIGWLAQQAETERLQRIAAMHKRSTPAAEKIVPAPWLAHPGKQHFLQLCMYHMENRLPETADIPGWRQKGSIECDEAGVHFLIERYDGTENWFSYMKDHIRSRPELQQIDAKSAKMTWPITFLSKAQSEKIHSYDQVKQFLGPEFKEINQSIDFAEPQIDHQNPGWMTRKLYLTNLADPLQYLPWLLKIDNLRFTQLTYQPENKFWSLTGLLYEPATIEDQ